MDHTEGSHRWVTQKGHTDGSVVRHLRSAWAFEAHMGRKMVKEGGGAFTKTTSAFSVEVTAVTRTLAWLEILTFVRVCFLGELVSVFKILSGEPGL